MEVHLGVLVGSVFVIRTRRSSPCRAASARRSSTKWRVELITTPFPNKSSPPLIKDPSAKDEVFTQNHTYDSYLEAYRTDLVLITRLIAPLKVSLPGVIQVPQITSRVIISPVVSSGYVP